MYNESTATATTAAAATAATTATATATATTTATWYDESRHSYWDGGFKWEPERWI